MVVRTEARHTVARQAPRHLGGAARRREPVVPLDAVDMDIDEAGDDQVTGEIEMMSHRSRRRRCWTSAGDH